MTDPAMREGLTLAYICEHPELLLYGRRSEDPLHVTRALVTPRIPYSPAWAHPAHRPPRPPYLPPSKVNPPDDLMARVGLAYQVLTEIYSRHEYARR